MAVERGKTGVNQSYNGIARGRGSQAGSSSRSGATRGPGVSRAGKPCVLYLSGNFE